ncbi:MAG: ABC transporter permease [bacterium]|nr:ABC transporter permease [bacterium]
MSAEKPTVRQGITGGGMTTLNKIIHKFGVYFVILLLVILGTILFQGKFFSGKNFLNIIDALTILGIAAVGVAFVTFSGHYADLSIPTTMAFSGIIAIECLPYGIVIAILAGVCTGIVIGLINAYVVGTLRANSIIWTLAMGAVTMGLMRWIWQNKALHPTFELAGESTAPEIFVNLYRMNVWGRISLPLVTAIILAIAAQFLLTKTQFGKQLKVTGSSYDVAKMTGISVTKVVGAAFLLSSFTASIAGIFVASLGQIGAYYQGQGYDFDAVTAVVLGGMTLSGGRGDIVGVIGGVFLLGLLKNILTLLGVDTFSQLVMQGITIIAVVGIHSYSLRKLGRDDE